MTGKTLAQIKKTNDKVKNNVSKILKRNGIEARVDSASTFNELMLPIDERPHNPQMGYSFSLIDGRRGLVILETEEGTQIVWK